MMSVRDKPMHKAMYFDLKIGKLIEHFSSSNPKGGYRKIHDFLEKHEFSHEQYSGYHSRELLTDLNIMDIIDDMKTELPWLEYCVRKFEVTNINDNYDLEKVFPELVI